MPELPEVETSCRGIEPHCVNTSIVKVDVRQPKLRWPVDSQLSKKLRKKTVTAVTRRGKYLQLQFESFELMIHLGMSGSLRIVNENVEVCKHDHVDIVLSNKKIIRYNDPRRFGSIILNEQGREHPLLAKLGVEPLDDEFDGEYLLQTCKNRKTAIKPLIMNSHVVVGVGNIYAQEALFQCGIDPRREANRISRARIYNLVDAIKQILTEAIKAGGSSLKDFTAADGKPGYFQHTHRVYGRIGEPCVKCQRALRQVVLGQRSTVYCGYCQK